jgi:hypothetical protein
MMKLENTTSPIEQRPTAVRSSVSRLRSTIEAWMRRHIVAEDPSPELSQLDQMDRIRRPNETAKYSGESTVRRANRPACCCSPARGKRLT